jgi:hypothetical protein
LTYRSEAFSIVNKCKLVVSRPVFVLEEKRRRRHGAHL